MCRLYQGLDYRDSGANDGAVTRILDSRTTGRGREQYLVRYDGWGAQDDRWVNKEDLFAEDLVSEYEAHRATIPQHGRRPGRPRKQPAPSTPPDALRRRPGRPRKRQFAHVSGLASSMLGFENSQVLKLGRCRLLPTNCTRLRPQDEDGDEALGERTCRKMRMLTCAAMARVVRLSVFHCCQR